MPLDLASFENTIARLREAFTESDLPWKVDFLDRHATQAHFLRVIENSSVPLVFAWDGAPTDA